MKKEYIVIGIYMAALTISLAACDQYRIASETRLIAEETATETEEDKSIIPEYSGSYVTTVNGNTPFFTEEEIEEWYYNSEDYCFYGELDELNRATGCTAKITEDTLCYEKRTESIAELKPSGWHTIRYDDLIEDKYLFNRCHLISYSSYNSKENTNVINNLVTGTRYMNLNETETEIEVNEFVEETGMPVLYRATPIYEGDDLVCKGILLEGYSDLWQFCRYYYNVQPGIIISYTDGSSIRE